MEVWTKNSPCHGLLDIKLSDTLEDITLKDTSDTSKRDGSENTGTTDTLGLPEVPSYKSETTETTETSTSPLDVPSDIKRFTHGTDTTDGTKDGESSMSEDNTSN